MMKTAVRTLIGVLGLAGTWACSNDEPVPLAQRPAREKIGPARLGWFSPAGEVFRRLGTPEKTELASAVETEGPDGPMPEIVSGSLESLAPAAVIMDHYQAACSRLGLDAPPAAHLLKAQPELTCHGRFDGQTLGVVVTPRCDGGRCIIFVEVRGQAL